MTGPGSVWVLRPNGNWDHYHDHFTFDGEANGALRIFAWKTTAPHADIVTACLYAPGAWVLARTLEPTP